MKIRPSFRMQDLAHHARTGRAVPKGAAIIGVYLFGMTGIAAGAYAMRDQIFNIPVAGTEIDDHMPVPAIQGDVEIPRNMGATARHSSLVPQAPRLAALNPTDTRLDDGLFSPLSRIFLGTPPVTPPDRPGASISETTPDEASELDTETAGLGVSLRPRLRPSDLRVVPDAAEQPVRLASLAAPESIEEAPAARTDPDAVPETPRMVAPSAQCPKRLARDIPRRRNGAPGARAFLASVQGVDGVKRDRFVVSEILKGNMPRFQKNLVPVSLRGTTSDGRPANITLCVTPDYLALGSDRDFVRVPLGLSAATQIAREFNMLLPTPRIVDAIYRQADLRLSPRPMAPGPQMTSTDYFMRHNATVEAQRRRAGAADGTLISGHKKDVVLTSRLASSRGRVAIYGWHRPNGQPIQPLSTVHGAGYADYSHGIRLVSRTAYLNGREVDLQSLIGDSRYAGLISHEGPLGRAVVASN